MALNKRVTVIEMNKKDFRFFLRGQIFKYFHRFRNKRVRDFAHRAVYFAVGVKGAVKQQIIVGFDNIFQFSRPLLPFIDVGDKNQEVAAV
jgi:hypothetical protein